MRGRDVVCLLSAISFGHCVIAAESYPVRPIRIIVPAAAGGSPDITARLIASELGKQLGQHVVVENRPGGSGVIAYDAIARATPDGYTIGQATFTIATNPSMFATLPYDALRDFRMVVHMTSGTNILAVGRTLTVTSIQDLVNLARQSPGQLSFGSSGNGTTMHLSMELLKQMTGINLLHVPYKGIQQAITDAISGQIQIVCDNIGSILPHVKDGRLRALAVTSLERSNVAPGVRTVAEQGVPGYEITPWSGLIVPARVPREIVLRLNSDFNKTISSSTFKEKFEAAGSKLVGETPEHFTEHVRKELTKWARVIKAAGIRPE